MSAKPDPALATMIANLQEKTGKSIEQWLDLARTLDEPKHGGLLKRLKADHGLTHGYANMVAHLALKTDAGSMSESVDLVEAQYSGDKAALKPIYDALVALIVDLGPDVELAPKKAYVSVRRSKQFAIIQPTTRTRLDLGLNLKGHDPEGRLEASGSFNSMVSHRVRLASPADVDATLAGWLRQAYEQA